MDFKRYFLPEHQIFLENINYERLPVHRPGEGEQMRLRCSDTIVSCREGDGCRITLNRRVSFEPEHLFYLSVSVGTRFRFDMRYYEEVDWSREDVAGAFRESNSPALTDMMARCSLLIAQITSATGHTRNSRGCGGEKRESLIGEGRTVSMRHEALRPRFGIFGRDIFGITHASGVRMKHTGYK